MSNRESQKSGLLVGLGRVDVITLTAQGSA